MSELRNASVLPSFLLRSGHSKRHSIFVVVTFDENSFVIMFVVHCNWSAGIDSEVSRVDVGDVEKSLGNMRGIYTLNQGYTLGPSEEGSPPRFEARTRISVTIIPAAEKEGERC